MTSVYYVDTNSGETVWTNSTLDGYGFVPPIGTEMVFPTRPEGGLGPWTDEECYKVTGTRYGMAVGMNGDTYVFMEHVAVPDPPLPGIYYAEPEPESWKVAELAIGRLGLKVGKQAAPDPIPPLTGEVGRKYEKVEQSDDGVPTPGYVDQ